MKVRVRELFDAIQWTPAQRHPAVATSVLEAGIDMDLHPEIYDTLKEADGQLGVIRVPKAKMWQIVHPGDWLIDRYTHWELCPEADFLVKFELVG